MRLGVSSSLKHATPEEWATNMKKLGLGAVVFPVDYTADESVIDGYVKAARENNLVIAEVGAWCNPVSPDEQVRKTAFERCVGQLKLADRIGARCCVNVAGSAGSRWDGAYRENFSIEWFDRTVQSIQDIIDTAKPKHTYYTIEPMPWMIPENPDRYLELIRAVDRERFAVHMDIVNWITSPKKYFEHEAFMEEAFGKLGALIRSCHLKNCRLGEAFTMRIEETSCREGTLNLAKYVELAEKANPDMPMIIEHLNTDEEYRADVAYMKQILMGGT